MLQGHILETASVVTGLLHSVVVSVLSIQHLLNTKNIILIPKLDAWKKFCFLDIYSTTAYCELFILTRFKDVAI